MKYTLPTLLLLLIIYEANCQTANITGKVTSEGQPVGYVSIGLVGTVLGTNTDSLGNFSIQDIPEGNYTLGASCIGFDQFKKQLSLKSGDLQVLKISLHVNSQSLNEVVITGTSRATLIRENPISIVSISSKAIDQANENNIIDALVKNAPGLNAVKTGPNISKPFIRGLGYNRVLTLYDGIRQEGQQWGDEHGIEVDDYNIDKAEVIKGPASLLYGSDALAGVVSLFPFTPTNDDGKLHGKLTSEYQTNNNLIGNGLRVDYSKNLFLFSLRGSYRMAKNYRNATDGRVYNTGFDEKNLSALLGYKATKGFSHLNFTFYDNLQGIPDGSRDSTTRQFTKQIYEGANDDITHRPIVSTEELNSYRFSPLHQHIQHYRIYNHSYYELGKGDIDLLLGFQQNIRREYNHPTDPEQAGLYIRLNTLNYGLRYNAPTFLNIETSIGINGMYQDNKSKNATDFPIPDYHLLDAGMYVYGKRKSNRWTVSGGLRFDVRQVQWNNFYIKKDSTTGFDQHVTFSNDVNATLQFPSHKKIFNGISASLGSTYRATQQISFKANISRGYRAPNITELSSNGLDPGAHIIYLGNINFNPEFSVQEDIGFSAKFKNASTDVSLFNNNIQNYIYISMLTNANGKPIVDAQGNKTYQYQQASAQLYGMEAWLSIHPEKLKGFSLDNSFSVVYGFNRNLEFKNAGTNGEYLPLIPPMKLLTSASQKINTHSKVFSSFSPKIEIENIATQNRYLGLNHSETLTTGYTLLNMGISTAINYSKTQTLNLQFQINNLFNKAYQSNLSRLKYFEYYSQSSSGYRGIFNAGRNFCMKLTLSF